MQIKKIWKTVIIFHVLFFLLSCEKPQKLVDQIKSSGELRFALLEEPARYYFDTQPYGFDYELARGFADSLNVRLKPVRVDFAYEVHSLVQQGKVMLGAAGQVPDTAFGKLQYGPEYNWVTQQLVYRKGQPRPGTLNDIGDEGLQVTASLQLSKLMVQLDQQYPNLPWESRKDKSAGSLLAEVNSGALTATISNSTRVNIYRNLFPELKVAFDMTDLKPEAWVIKKNRRDDSLFNAMHSYFIHINSNGTLKKLKERYFRHFDQFNYVDVTKFLDRVEKRLPIYEPLFKKAANQYRVDWKLLAALSYQESHWNNKARSPTGVRGLMMLTLDTAKHVNVTNRNDPEQSIDGGARYLLEVQDKIPARIKSPDRMWFTLAAYNIGFAHLEDARVLTQKLGGDPDEWVDVRERLPLLSQPEWHEQTRYGHARGQEPVTFVENIRRYYDILSWVYFLKEKQARQKEQGPGSIRQIRIDSPVL